MFNSGSVQSCSTAPPSDVRRGSASPHKSLEFAGYASLPMNLCDVHLNWFVVKPIPVPASDTRKSIGFNSVYETSSDLVLMNIVSWETENMEA